MSDKKLLLVIDSDPLRQAKIEELIQKTLENINLCLLKPAEVEVELKTIKNDQIATIIIDQGVFVDKLFYGGIQLIQRLRAIHRLRSSMTLISPDNKPPDLILAYSGHFFLPRSFQEEQFLSTLEEAMNTRLSERELQKMIDGYCLPQLITGFRCTIVGHGIGHLRAFSRLALNGKREKAESKLSKNLGYLRELRQRKAFTALTVALDSRFERQLAEIDQIFDQMQCSLEHALNTTKNSASSELQRIKSEFNEKSEANPFVDAENRLKAVLLDVEEQIKV